MSCVKLKIYVLWKNKNSDFPMLVNITVNEVFKNSTFIIFCFHIIFNIVPSNVYSVK